MMNHKFNDLASLLRWHSSVPQYVAYEDIKMAWYIDMFRTKIREFMNATQFTNLSTIIEVVSRRELDLEKQA